MKPPAEEGAAPQVLNYQRLFEAAPGNLVVVMPDDPRFTIVAVSDAHLRATGKSRGELIGRGIFEVFPGGPDRTHTTTIDNLRASFHKVISTGQPHTMSIQRYDLPRLEPKGGEMEERYWSPVTSPVLGPDGRVELLIHRIEAVTEIVGLKSREAGQHQMAETERVRADQFEAELFLHRRELAQEKELNEERKRTASAVRESESGSD